MTAQEIIEDALSEIRVKRAGFSVSNEDIQLGLRVLNRMMNHWSGAESLMVPWRTREELSMSGGARSYTIGSGGTLNTVRPTAIHLARLKSGSTEYHLRQASLEQIENRPDKTSTGRPDLFYYEPADPLGTIYFELTTDQAYTLILWSVKPMTSFTAITTEDSVPEEYGELLVTNLAVRLAPHFAKEAAQTTKAMAVSTKANIEGHNLMSRVPTLVVDHALRRGRFDFTSGDFSDE